MDVGVGVSVGMDVGVGVGVGGLAGGCVCACMVFLSTVFLEKRGIQPEEGGLPLVAFIPLDSEVQKRVSYCSKKLDKCPVNLLPLLLWLCSLEHIVHTESQGFRFLLHPLQPTSHIPMASHLLLKSSSFSPY